MNQNVEKRSKEIFDEAQAKQARVAKKALFGALGGCGFIFAVLGAVFFMLGDLYKEIGIVFLPMGLALIALGAILYFVIPTKYNYKKYQERAKKYGYVDVYSMAAKIAELEARIEELEKKNG